MTNKLCAALTLSPLSPAGGLTHVGKLQAAGGGAQAPALRCCLTVLVMALTMAVGHAQTFSTIRSFGILTNVTGVAPRSTLVQGPDGTLYGTTSSAEGTVQGTIFKVQSDGSGFTVLK